MWRNSRRSICLASDLFSGQRENPSGPIITFIVFLRGVNVGGHRRFRPAKFVRTLKILDVLNIGATGIFLVRTRISKNALRALFARGLLSAEPFAQRTIPRGTVKFVSILSRRTHSTPGLPFAIPAGRRWLVRVLGRRGRFVYGLHRRTMKVIGALGQLDDLIGTPVTTRSWGTMEKTGAALRMH